MNSIRKILDKILEVACILIFGIMTILVVYQVVTRYVFQSPSSWSESVVTYGFIWLAMLGGAYVFGKTVFPWTTSAAKLRKMTFPTSSSGSTIWTRKLTASAQSRAFLCRNRKSQTTTMTCPSTSTKRWSMCRWSTPLPQN